MGKNFADKGFFRIVKEAVKFSTFYEILKKEDKKAERKENESSSSSSDDDDERYSWDMGQRIAYVTGSNTFPECNEQKRYVHDIEIDIKCELIPKEELVQPLNGVPIPAINIAFLGDPGTGKTAFIDFVLKQSVKTDKHVDLRTTYVRMLKDK